MRVVWLVQDIHRIGGISNSTRMAIRGQSGGVHHVALSLDRSAPDTGDLAEEQSYVLSSTGPFPDWSPEDTVVMCPNDVVRDASDEAQAWLYRFPIIFQGSGQLSYHLQDRDYFKRRKSFDRFRVSHIVCLSELDQLTYQQFGIQGTTVLSHPIEQRAENSYSATANRHAGYVGRVDFRTRGCDRLVDVARAVEGTRFAPLIIRTTDPAESFSPDLEKLQDVLKAEGLEDVVEFEFGKFEGSDLYADLALLVSPARKESFGLALVEAMSFGVPVVASSYCPGTRDIVSHGVDGYLLDDWSTECVREALAAVEADMQTMSGAAFERHRAYQLAPYLEQLESLAAQVLRDFDGTNRLAVFPNLVAVDRLSDQVESQSAEISELKAAKKVIQREVGALRRDNASLERKMVNREARIDQLTEQLQVTRAEWVRRQPLRIARVIVRRAKRLILRR